MGIKLEKRPSYAVLAVWCALFFTVWTLQEVILKPVTGGMFSPLQTQLFYGGLKLLVWTLPAVILIRVFGGGLFLTLREMLTNKIPWPKMLAAAGAFCVYQLAGALLRFGKLAVHRDFEPLGLIGAVLVVGLTEEIVFRGWLLNALIKKMPEQAAISLTSALFVLIHFPIWSTKGYFSDAFTLITGIVSIFALSLIFSYAFLKTKNIIAPSLLHMLWNLLVVVLSGG